MRIDIKRLPKSVVEIKGSLTAEEFEEHITKATNHIVNEAALAGFRKGKAPERLVVEKVGDAHILEKAAHAALEELYLRALKEHAIHAIGPPEIRITKLARGNPLEWEAMVVILPRVVLPDYKEIAKEKNAEPRIPASVSDEEVLKALEQLQNMRSRTLNGEKKMPELNDEFAKLVGAFTTLEELKETIRKNITAEKAAKEADARKMKLLEAIAEKTSLEIPDILIEREKEKMVQELQANITSLGMEWKEYLQHIKKKEEDLQSGWHADAEKRITFALLLKEVAEREHITPSEDELNAWTYQYLASQDDRVKKSLDPARVKEYAYGVIRNEKVSHFLEQC